MNTTVICSFNAIARKIKFEYTVELKIQHFFQTF